MTNSVRTFLRTCEAEGIHYKEPRELESGRTDVTLGVTGSAGNEYNVRFIFDDDGQSVQVRVFGFAKVTKDNYAKLLMACNKLNDNYRWLKFDIDEDLDLNIEADAIIDERTAGTVCKELFYHVMGIAKKAYPELMKAIWG